MSVRVADRTESKMSFVYETMNLCEIVSKVVANKPKKYKQNWGDKIIETSLEAWRLTQMANSIYVCKSTPIEDIKLRHEWLITAKANIDWLSSLFTINSYNSWRGYAKKCDSYKTIKNMDKLYYQLNERRYYD